MEEMIYWKVLDYTEPNESGTTISEIFVALSVSTTNSFTVGLGVPGCKDKSI